jgi:DNA-binding GntR family transcriptional regulator
VTSLGEIRVASLRDEVTRALRGAIASGEIEPGRVYSAPGLAQRLGVSATPVREAMLKLAGLGIVDPVRNRGFSVRPLTQHDLDEVLELRGLVEPPLLAGVAGRLGAATTDALRRAAARARRAVLAGDLRGWAEHDGELYLGLVGAAGNAPALELLTGLRDYAGLYGLLPAVAAEHRAELAARQEAVLDAVAGGSREATERAVRDHLALTHRAWSSVLAGRRDAADGAPAASASR